VTAVWVVRTGRGAQLARGPVDVGPREFLHPELALDMLLSKVGPSLADVAAMPAWGPVTPGSQCLAPAGSQPVWAAGVTYQRSHDARRAESATPDHYDHVYGASRPELFVKALPGTVRGSGDPVMIRSDSTWDVPEPELALVLDVRGHIVGLTVGNDMSSRSIEGENPLYLPQAKVYTGSCVLGPAIVPVAEAPPIADLQIAMTIRRGGHVAYHQEVRVNQMRRSPHELASWLCRAQQLPVGAFLLTGTALVPPASFTLRRGDEIDIEISAIGLLRNVVDVLEVGE
jgi:2-dehydro-3-deoxy-D-arabinonate dehydratase